MLEVVGSNLGGGRKGRQVVVMRRLEGPRHSLRASLNALAASDPSTAREAQRGDGHGVSGVQAVDCNHTALP